MQVLGIEDVEMRHRKTGASLFKEDELTSLEDKLTSASFKSQPKGLKTQGSVATVLS